MNFETAIQKIIDYFSDKSKGIWSKIATLILIILGIFLTDGYFKFSYNFKVNSQIEQIGKIETIIKDTKDSTLITELKSIEKTIIDKRSTYDYFSALYNSISRQTKNATINISTNPILHYLSSNLLLLVFISWASRGLKKYKVTKIIWWILLLGILIGLTIWISGLITAFFISSDTNIFLKLLYNSLFQVLVVAPFYALLTINNRKKEKNEKKKDDSKDTPQ